MNQKFLVFIFQICTMTTCAFQLTRYSDNMQDQSQLPQELSTAHEVILVQSNAIVAQKSQIDQLTKEREILRAEIRFLMSGKKREKFIGADQLLIEFKDDKELQAALEAAKKEAEEDLEKITYTRSKAPKERKRNADKFPAHLPREEVSHSTCVPSTHRFGRTVHQTLRLLGVAQDDSSSSSRSQLQEASAGLCERS